MPALAGTPAHTFVTLTPGALMPSIKTLVQTAAISLAVVVAYSRVQAGGGPRLGA